MGESVLSILMLLPSLGVPYSTCGKLCMPTAGEPSSAADFWSSPGDVDVATSALWYFLTNLTFSRNLSLI
jgi:hypothetical protein